MATFSLTLFTPADDEAGHDSDNRDCPKPGFVRHVEPATGVGTPESGDDPYLLNYVIDPGRFAGQTSENKPFEIRIPREPVTMRAALRRELESAYVLYSWDGVDRFAVAVFGDARYGNLLSHGQWDRDKYSAKGGKRIEALRERVSQERSALWQCFERERSSLIKDIENVQQLIESHAACRAVSIEIRRSRETITREVKRYLNLVDQEDTTIRAVLTGGHAYAYGMRLNESEGKDLWKAARALAPLMRNMRSAQSEYKEKVLMSTAADAVVLAAILQTALMPLIPVSQEWSQSAADDKSKAIQSLQISTRALTDRFTVLAAAYPILFKTADLVLESEHLFTVGVVEALQEAWAACEELEKKFMDTSLAWQFPALIDRTINAGFGGEAQFAERVAANKLEAVNGMTPIQGINAVIQGIDTALMLVPHPAVKAATLVASIIGDVAEFMETYLRTAEQRIAYRAALDPSLAMAPNASYLSLLASAVFMALNILPLPGAMKELREKVMSDAARKTKRIGEAAGG